jgi:hypothetical protein
VGRNSGLPAIEYHVNASSFQTPTINKRNVQVVASKSLTLNEKTNTWICLRGIDVSVRKNRTTNIRKCLCPPAYYDDHRQYQSQRVSLTLQLRAEADWKTTFALSMTLVDEQQNIQSYDQIQYLAVRDCTTKFNIHLLYSTQPKNISKNYSVHIDAYDKNKLIYRSSWIYPIRFPFLTVYRRSDRLTIPVKTSESCNLACTHGQCIRFLNKNEYSNRCDPGWKG